MVSLLLGELVPHNERVVGNTWNGVRKCVWKTWCIGFSTIQLRRFVEGCNCFSRSYVPLGVLDTTWVKLHGTSSPPTLRMKCRVLKIGKCTWSRCHVVASPELQANWISVGVVYIWKSTQVTNNHVREFKSMPLPSRALRSNLITLVWLVMLVWNPIALFLSFGLGSSQVVEAWRYTGPGPSP